MTLNWLIGQSAHVQLTQASALVTMQINMLDRLIN